MIAKCTVFIANTFDFVRIVDISRFYFINEKKKKKGIAASKTFGS